MDRGRSRTRPALLENVQAKEEKMSEANWGQMENRIAELKAENDKLRGLLKEWVNWGAGERDPLRLLQRTLTHSRSCGYHEDFGTGECTCCLKERIALQTEQTMHAAWRKRAEEAEAKLEQEKRKAFEAGWEKRGNACYPSPADWEFDVAWEDYQAKEKQG